MNQHELKELRKNKGLTALQAARLVHVNARTWQRYEAGDIKASKAIVELFKIKTGESAVSEKDKVLANLMRGKKIALDSPEMANGVYDALIAGGACLASGDVMTSQELKDAGCSMVESAKGFSISNELIIRCHNSEAFKKLEMEEVFKVAK